MLLSSSLAKLPNKEYLITAFKIWPFFDGTSYCLSILVKFAWFCCKRLQNDGALNFVQFFLDSCVYTVNICQLRNTEKVIMMMMTTITTTTTIFHCYLAHDVVVNIIHTKRSSLSVEASWVVKLSLKLLLMQNYRRFLAERIRLMFIERQKFDIRCLWLE